MSLTDTSPEAERILSEIYRRMTPGKKWLLAGEAYRTSRVLHAAGVCLRNPEATPRQILEDWIHRVLGFPHVQATGDPPVDQPPLNLGIAREVIRVFVRLGVSYALGGSLASSIHGIPRQTQDSDITVEPFLDKLQPFLTSFGAGYYVSADAIADAHRRHSSFNIIDANTGLKADIFICPEGGFEQTALSRRQPVALADLPEEPLDVFRPEDVVLFKLRWYRLGNEVSDRQWADILGVLKTQLGRVDESYLDHWAQVIGVADLLARARQEIASA